MDLRKKMMSNLWYRQSRDLVGMAEMASLEELELIMRILSERKNDVAFDCLRTVGDIYEKKKRNLHQSKKKSKLEYDGYFEWPTTDAPASRYGYEGNFWFYTDGQGVLGFVGYKVGKQGIYQSTRRKILDAVFHNKLPNVISHQYMSEWGLPKSPQRLLKMANSLAAFARNGKRNSLDMSDAISDWEVDLEYLRQTYYIGYFRYHDHGPLWPII